MVRAWPIVVYVAVASCSAGPTESASIAIPVQSAQLAVAGNTTCLLTPDGVPVCWGPSGTATVPGAGSIHLASIQGGGHFCGLSVDSTAYCWGTNTYGQLGDGSRSDRANPVRVSGSTHFVAIAPAARTTCALDGGGRAYCWGQNDHAGLGIGTYSEDEVRLEPVRVSGDTRFKALGGQSPQCAIAVENGVYCWGRLPGSFDPDYYSAPGDCKLAYYIFFTGAPCVVPTAVAAAEALVAQSGGSCGINALGEARCWGDGSYGQLGSGEFGYTVPSVPVAGGTRFRTMAVGVVHVCALDLDGAPWCWGSDLGGQLGDGGGDGAVRIPIVSSTPVRSATAARFGELAAGAHTCALTQAREVYCWGPFYSNVPTKVNIPLPSGLQATK